MTIKQCITNALEDLKKTGFRKFCHLLTDRRNDPLIRRSAVEHKSIWEIAELLVSTFTEPKALQVALDTLRQMNCNQEAKTLEQDTKALLNSLLGIESVSSQSRHDISIPPVSDNVEMI